MSLEALSWAFEVPVASSVERLVLLAYAEHCGSGRRAAWPSRQRIRDRTLLDLKTISSTIRRLVAKGLLIDTGQRKGSSGRVPVYRLAGSNASENGTIESTQKRNDWADEIDPNFPANATENGSLNRPKNGTRKQVLNQEMKREAVSQAARNGSSLPQAWKPDPETEAWARQRRPDLNFEITVEKFVLHFVATGGTRADWGAAFRKWVLDEQAPKGTSAEPKCAAHSTERSRQVLLEAEVAKRAAVPCPKHIKALIKH